MIASSFALTAATPPSFPANFQTPPPAKTKPISLSMFEIWQSALTMQMATMGTMMRGAYNLQAQKRMTNIFDASVFQSYFEPIPGALKALSTDGLKTLIEPILHEASSANANFAQGVYMDVAEDNSFTLYLADANGKGIAATFESNQDMLNLYALTSVNETSAFNVFEEPVDYETSQELGEHFQTMIRQIDRMIAARKPPEPNPPGGGVELSFAA